MNPAELIVAALVIGIAAGLKETAAPAAVDGYASLKAYIQRKYEQVDLGLLEAAPESRARQAVTAEDLRKSGADVDAGLLDEARKLLHAAKGESNAYAMGANLEDIKAGSLRLTDIAAEGRNAATGVRIRDADVAGAIDISHVTARAAVRTAAVPAAGDNDVQKVTILVLAANPRETEPLRLDQETRAIDQALLQAALRDRFELQQHWAVRVTDVQELLLRHRPQIVHFSGHGTSAGELVLEDATGHTMPVAAEALSHLFAAFRHDIRCVVLNACYSAGQAAAIARQVGVVIGVTDAVQDQIAIDFAAAFYRALGYGKDFKSAFDLARAQLHLQGFDEESVAHFVIKT